MTRVEHTTGRTVYYNDQNQIHRENGPAIIYTVAELGMGIWVQHGVQHNLHGSIWVGEGIEHEYCFRGKDQPTVSFANKKKNQVFVAVNQGMFYPGKDFNSYCHSSKYTLKHFLKYSWTMLYNIFKP